MADAYRPINEACKLVIQYTNLCLLSKFCLLRADSASVSVSDVGVKNISFPGCSSINQGAIVTTVMRSGWVFCLAYYHFKCKCTSKADRVKNTMGEDKNSSYPLHPDPSIPFNE